MLGPQASPPARVQPKPTLVTGAGEDACGPSTKIRVPSTDISIASLKPVF